MCLCFCLKKKQAQSHHIQFTTSSYFHTKTCMYSRTILVYMRIFISQTRTFSLRSMLALCCLQCIFFSSKSYFTRKQRSKMDVKDRFHNSGIWKCLFISTHKKIIISPHALKLPASWCSQSPDVVNYIRILSIFQNNMRAQLSRLRRSFELHFSCFKWMSSTIRQLKPGNSRLPRLSPLTVEVAKGAVVIPPATEVLNSAVWSRYKYK